MCAARFRCPPNFDAQTLNNLVICVPGRGGTNPFSCMIAGSVPDLGFCGSGTQVFPMFIYEEISMNDIESYLVSEVDERERAVNKALREKSNALAYGGFIYQLGYLEALANLAEFRNAETTSKRIDSLIEGAAIRARERGFGIEIRRQAEENSTESVSEAQAEAV